MKKYLLLLALVCFAFTSCGTDETLTTDEPASSSHSVFRAGYWDGTIGVDAGSGVYHITVNPQSLMADLEAALRAEGDTVTLQTIGIFNKKATNDNTDGYMLIATDNASTSIGLMLAKGADNTFKLNRGMDDSYDPAVSCRGCATGCNLEHLNMPGGKFPYCNSNGCGDFCQTKYASVL